jgi:hypothetical protein
MTATAKVATFLGSISASSGTVKSEWRQMKQCYMYKIRINRPNGLVAQKLIKLEGNQIRIQVGSTGRKNTGFEKSKIVSKISIR